MAEIWQDFYGLKIRTVTFKFIVFFFFLVHLVRHSYSTQWY
jgi:hypothetical protein